MIVCHSPVLVPNLGGIPCKLRFGRPCGFVAGLGQQAPASTQPFHCLLRLGLGLKQPLLLMGLQQRLLADLRQCAMPYTCPHGRPTLIHFSYHELHRKFGRA